MTNPFVTMPVIGPLSPAGPAGPVGPVQHPALFPSPESENPSLPSPVVISDDKRPADDIDHLQNEIDRIVEHGHIRVDQTPAEEGSNDKTLQKKDAGASDPYYPPQGNGPEFRPEPRLGQDDDAAAWPFGEGNDDIDPKWGRTRDKLKDKKGPCEWI